jgi:hypothetical protein
MTRWIRAFALQGMTLDAVDCEFLNATLTVNWTGDWFITATLAEDGVAQQLFRVPGTFTTRAGRVLRGDVVLDAARNRSPSQLKLRGVSRLAGIDFDQDFEKSPAAAKVIRLSDLVRESVAGTRGAYDDEVDAEGTRG